MIGFISKVLNAKLGCHDILYWHIKEGPFCGIPWPLQIHGNHTVNTNHLHRHDQHKSMSESGEGRKEGRGAQVITQIY